MTDAATHDSQVIDDLLDDDNTASEVWADSAYRSAEIEEKLEDRGLKSRIHRKAHRNRPRPDVTGSATGEVRPESSLTDENNRKAPPSGAHPGA